MTKLEIAMHKTRLAHQTVAWLGDLYELQAEVRPNSPLEAGINQAIACTIDALRQLENLTWE